MIDEDLSWEHAWAERGRFDTQKWGGNQICDEIGDFLERLFVVNYMNHFVSGVCSAAAAPLTKWQHTHGRPTRGDIDLNL